MASASLWLLLPQSGLVGYLDPVAPFHLESSTKITPFAASGSPAAAEGASSVAATAAELGFATTAAELLAEMDLEIAPLAVPLSLAEEGQEV